MRFEVIEFPSRMFTFNRENKTLVAEASDLGNRHLQPLYDDAADIGFAVKSDVTGNVVNYVMVDEIKDNEGEVQGWNYLPAFESIRKYPECDGTKAIIFND